MSQVTHPLWRDHIFEPARRGGVFNTRACDASAYARRWRLSNREHAEHAPRSRHQPWRWCRARAQAARCAASQAAPSNARGGTTSPALRCARTSALAARATELFATPHLVLLRLCHLCFDLLHALQDPLHARRTSAQRTLQTHVGPGTRHGCCPWCNQTRAMLLAHTQASSCVLQLHCRALLGNGALQGGRTGSKSARRVSARHTRLLPRRLLRQAR